MMRHFLAGLVAVLALPAMAQAPTPPAPAPAAAPAAPAPTASVFSPSRAALAQAATGMVQPAGQGLPPGLPGMAAQPAQPGLPMPVNPNIPQPAGTSAEQEVPALFVGRINGTSVYRATGGGYLFDKAKRQKAVPKETGSIADGSAASNAPTAGQPVKK